MHPSPTTLPEARRYGRRRWTIALAAAIASLTAAALPVGAQPSAAEVAPLSAFAATSWWNTPLGNAPVDPNSARYIADSQLSSHSQDYLRFSIGAWGAPVYHAAATDPVVTVVPSKYGNPVTVRIPVAARPQPTSDAEMTVFDPTSNQVVGLWRAAYDAITGSWTAGGVDRYLLDSDGLAKKAGGPSANGGHRGISAAYRGVRQDELLSGRINHRLEIFWWATAPATPEGARAYWPMTNSEQGKGGIVPEGIVVRIKPSVDLSTRNLSPAALVVARALQTYGAVVGDNSGTGNNLKLQSNVSWTGLLTADSLASVPWSDYEFVKGGYRP